MFCYLLEISEWVNDGKLKYYHLLDSKTFQSSKDIEDQTYFKDNKFYTLSKIDFINEIKRKRRRTKQS